MANRGDYLLETGACLMGFYLVALMTGAIAVGIAHGIWLLWFALPPLCGVAFCFGHLWKTRPSILKK